MPRLGINITDNVYYAPDRPFTNLADRGRHYFSASNTVYAEDALGWPQGIVDSNDVYMRIDLGKGHPNGTYNFNWDGPNNAIQVDGATNGTTSGTFVKSTDTLTVLMRFRQSVSGLRVWHSSDNIAQTFSTDFLEFMKDFKTIRFMNWCSVNMEWGSAAIAPDWSKRRKRHSFTQSRPSFAVYGETAWELIAELCNTTRSACWICIHHLGDATWIAKVAKLMHKELDADIPLIVEHSNEIWNGAFEQNVYSRAPGVGNMADTDVTRRAFVWHAKRTALISDIFKAHCKGRPLDITLGLQAAAYGFFDFAKSTDPTDELAPALAKIDSYAIAPYFGGYVAGTGGATATQLRDLVLSGGVDEVFTQIQTQYGLGTEANPWTQMTQWATRATADAKVLRGYEGGQHAVAQGGDQSNSALTTILTNANRDSRMYNLYLEYLDGWKTRTSDAEMCLFNACQAFDQYGSWGLEEFQNQKVISGSSAVPKYQAVLDWIGGKTSTTGDPTGTFFRAVTALPAVPEPNTIYAIKATTDSDCQIVMTDRGGAIVPLNTGNVYVDVFETPGTGTWTKRAGAVMVKAIAIGGGNGGGSGRRGAAGSDRYGGGGGGGGGIAIAEFPASNLGATEFIWVGAGGAGGAAVTSNDTNGNPGITGYPSAFGCTDNTLSGSTATGTKLKTGAGIPAGGGTNAAGAAGTGGAGFPGLALIGNGSSGGAGSNGAGAAATASGLACPGGGGGGGINTSNTAAAGGAGGGTGLASGSGPIAFYVGGAGGTVGQPGEDGANASTPVPGSGGGGGGASTSAAGGDGGAGGIYGAGGGGGGASANGFASGKGGDGANGCVVVVTHTKRVGTNDNLLVVSFGESNSGGQVPNADAQSWEIASRSDIQMWNINTNVWEDLDLGTNNNLDHATAMPNYLHSWELGLANRKRQGFFPGKTIYYVQTGQGGSTLSQWNVGGAYWTKFLTRTTNAKAALTAGTYSTAVWITLGINDALAMTPAATFKSGMQELIGRIKSQLPGCKIYLATLPPVNLEFIANSAKILEIAAEDSESVRAVSVTSPVELPMQDSYHWNYQGMKRLSARMTAATLADLGIQSKSVAFGSRNDAGWHYSTAGAQHEATTTPLDCSVDGWVALSLVNPDSNGLVIGLDTEPSIEPYTAPPDNWILVYNFNATVATRVAGVDVPISGISAPCWVRLRWYAANDNVDIETSTDGGVTWVNRETRVNALAGVSSVYVKSSAAVGAAVVDVWRS